MSVFLAVLSNLAASNHLLNNGSLLETLRVVSDESRLANKGCTHPEGAGGFDASEGAWLFLVFLREGPSATDAVLGTGPESVEGKATGSSDMVVSIPFPSAQHRVSLKSFLECWP